jgi:AbrB family looped-hinge helix DNA binding protein
MNGNHAPLCNPLAHLSPRADSHKVWGLDGHGNTCDGNTMKVTTKGQVTIPARIREYLDIAPHSNVDFRISGDAVVLVKDNATREPRRRFAALRGILKGTPTTQEWMRATRGN